MSFNQLLQTPITSEASYFDYVRALYEEWKDRDNNGYPTFKRLSWYFENLDSKVPPHFFTGSIEAPVVIISLNSHSGEKNDREIDMKDYCETWDDYKKFFTNFPSIRYSKKVAETVSFLSNFDCKLHRFLSGDAAKPTREALAKWNIFHVELCPIASSSFELKRPDSYICNYLLRTLEAIALYPRSLVLVINNRVCLLLDKMEKQGFLKLEKEASELTPPGGGIMLRRIDYSITLSGIAPIRIVAAPSYAYQSISHENLIAYGKWIVPNAVKKQALGLD